MRDIERYEKEYEKDSFETYQVKYRRTKLLERIEYWTEDVGHPLNVLEVGIGLEPLFQFVKSFDKWTCVEPGLEFVKHAEQTKNPRVRIINGFMEDCIEQVNNQKFDYIIVSGLLNEVENPKALLGAIQETADKNTVIHINVANANSLHRVLAKESGLIASTTDFSERNRVFQQHNVFDMTSLLNLIQSQGQIIVEARGGYFVKPFSHKQMQEMLEKNIISEKVLDGLYRLIEYMPELGSEIYVDFRFL